MRTIPSLGLARVTDIGAASDCVVLTCKKKKRRKEKRDDPKKSELVEKCMHLNAGLVSQTYQRRT